MPEYLGFKSIKGEEEKRVLFKGECKQGACSVIIFCGTGDVFGLPLLIVECF